MPFKDVDPDELRQLVEEFRKAGADDPESWARSQLAEGIPQLALFSFAKALWQCVVSEDNDTWIDGEIELAKKRPNAPCAQIGPALQEMIDRGVSRESITDLVRVIQYDALYHACSILDGSRVEDVPITKWKVQHVDDEGKPIETINCMHEVLLGLDPTGREMRPRPRPK